MSERWYTFIEQGPNDKPVEVLISRTQILRTYWGYWTTKMRAAGLAHLITPEGCVEDFCVVHWAAPVQGRRDGAELKAPARS